MPLWIKVKVTSAKLYIVMDELHHVQESLDELEARVDKIISGALFDNVDVETKWVGSNPTFASIVACILHDTDAAVSEMIASAKTIEGEEDSLQNLTKPFNYALQVSCLCVTACCCVRKGSFIRIFFSYID